MSIKLTQIHPDDLENQSAALLARQEDPLGKRTMGANLGPGATRRLVNVTADPFQSQVFLPRRIVSHLERRISGSRFFATSPTPCATGELAAVSVDQS